MKRSLMKAALLLAVSLCAVTLVSCSDDDVQPAIKPKFEAMNFTCGTYSKSLPIELTNIADWNVDVVYNGSETDWITPEKKADAVVVSVEPNTASTARSAKLILSAAGIPDVTVTVSQKAQFSSTLIGSYSPGRTETYDYGVILNTKWNDKGAPKLFMGNNENGDPEYLEWGLVEMLVPSILSGYMKGLNRLELLDDGRLAAKYYEIDLGANMENILAPNFGKEVFSFPDPVTLPIVPVDAVTYYSDAEKIYLALDKQFIASVDPGTLGMPVCSLIDGMISQYKLGLVSNAEHYAVPLKYKVEGGILLLYVDRTMILPFKQLLLDVINKLLPSAAAAATGGEEGGLNMDPEAVKQFVADIFDNSTTFELGIVLAKGIEI